MLSQNVAHILISHCTMYYLLLETKAYEYNIHMHALCHAKSLLNVIDSLPWIVAHP